MALVKKTRTDTATVGEFKHIRCKHFSWVEEDGVLIGARSTEVQMIAPGDDVSNNSQEVQDLVAFHQTPAIVDAYKAHLAIREV
jgi:hypothetical protein